jgi:hypothetical protein
MRDELLAENPPPDDCINYEQAQRVARLALLITQRRLAATLLSPSSTNVRAPQAAMATWESRSPEERARMTASVIRVLQAMILLGLIEYGDIPS